MALLIVNYNEELLLVRADKTIETESMNPTERRATSTLASIYALRMLGLFMIMPVFALYAQTLEGTTPQLIGLAIGAYGLTQAIFQIPFGMVSDRIGRKPVIVFGLIIFALGSVLAAMADSIWGVIWGRALQGAGAIPAVVMALTADLTREEHRTTAMATIGLSIGLSFAFSLVAGPLVASWIGVNGIFWLTGLLALLAIVMLYVAVPNPARSTFHRDAQANPSQFGRVLVDPELLRLDAGIFILHMVLTATFVVMPLALRDNAGLDAAHHWWVYLPVLLLGLGLMVPFVVIAEKRRKMKPVFTGSVVVMAIAEFILAADHHAMASIVLALGLFFIAFNVLEATLPSLIAKTSPPDIKGTAMGMYSTSQFAGAFAGGAVGGTLHANFGMQAVFLFCGVAMLVWVFIAATMRNPPYLSTLMIKVGPVDSKHAKDMMLAMLAVPGVAEAVVVPEDGIAYLKVDSQVVDKSALAKYKYQDAVS